MSLLAVVEAVEPLDVVLADAVSELLLAGMPRLALAVERARELVGPREEFGPPREPSSSHETSAPERFAR